MYCFEVLKSPKKNFEIAERHVQLVERKRLSNQESYDLVEVHDLLDSNPKFYDLLTAAEVCKHLNEKLSNCSVQRDEMSDVELSELSNSITLENLCLAKEYYSLSITRNLSEIEIERMTKILEQSQSDPFWNLLVNTVDRLAFEKLSGSGCSQERYLDEQRDKIRQSISMSPSHRIQSDHRRSDVFRKTLFNSVVNDPILEVFLTTCDLRAENDESVGETYFSRDKVEERALVVFSGFPITALPFVEQLNLILQWAREGESKAVCVADVHLFIEAYRNKAVKKVLQAADLIPPGGMPLVWWMRIMGVRGQERVSGMSLLLELCERAPYENISLFFLGNILKGLERAKEKLGSEFPKLKVAGIEHLPYRPLTSQEDEALVKKINSSGAGIVFVSLARSKQELWISQHRGKIQAVLIGVGAEFPVYAEVCHPVPPSIEQAGFAWLYRTFRDPRQFLMHYISKIGLLVFLVGQQLFRRLWNLGRVK